MRVGLAVATTVLAMAVCAPGALADRYATKGIWGPVSLAGKSQFPLYQELGTGTYEIGLSWALTAPQRPKHPRNPRDPAYQWPSDIAYAIHQAAAYHMHVLVEVEGTPAWANGGRPRTYRPSRITDWTNFLTAAARRYPTVHMWMMWGEPTRNLLPIAQVPATARRLTKQQAAAPRFYARLVDASYARLKSISKRNVIIAGDTYTTGDISTRLWIEYMRLPNGLPPRMDLYGHNPFSFRAPNLSNPPSPDGEVDFSDLGRLDGWVNRYLGKPRHRKIKLFLPEWTIPTAPGDNEFNFYVDPTVAAQWVTDAWRIVRRSSFIVGMGWIHVMDDPPGPPGSRGGLETYNGIPKPDFWAWKAG